jgi:hypothetical protein
MRQEFLSRLRLPHSQPDIFRKTEEAIEMCFVKNNKLVKHVGYIWMKCGYEHWWIVNDRMKMEYSQMAISTVKTNMI